VPGLKRSYGSFSAFTDEGSRARILGGMSFHVAVEDAVTQEKNVADWVLDHYLRPLEGH
jgi:hypothetical protein